MRPLLPCLVAMFLAGADMSSTLAADDASQHQISGTIRGIKGSLLTVETRDKRMLEVDAKTAIESHRTNPLVVGGFISASGTLDKKGLLHAQTIQRAKKPSAWPPDR